MVFGYFMIGVTSLHIFHIIASLLATYMTGIPKEDYISFLIRPDLQLTYSYADGRSIFIFHYSLPQFF